MDTKGCNYVKERMPLIGLGTYQVKDPETIFSIVDAALGCGYRMIDTAQVYGNEQAIGDALQTLLPKYNLKREDIFLISKLKPYNQGKARAQDSIEETLKHLQVDYLDLFIIHWPGAYAKDVKDPINAELRAQSWTVMEQMHQTGKLRAIGVSNYEIGHLQTLLSSATVLPALNQCEYHPHFAQLDLVDYCNQHGIVFQAYSSLGSPRFIDKLLDDAAIRKMAIKYECSVTHFLLAWAMSQGISVLPRSRNPDHVIDNFKSTEYRISQEDIKAVTAVSQHKYCWNPATVV